MRFLLFLEHSYIFSKKKKIVKWKLGFQQSLNKELTLQLNFFKIMYTFSQIMDAANLFFNNKKCCPFV